LDPNLARVEKVEGAPVDWMPIFLLKMANRVCCFYQPTMIMPAGRLARWMQGSPTVKLPGFYWFSLSL
jgi:hypothetical protein